MDWLLAFVLSFAILCVALCVAFINHSKVRDRRFSSSFRIFFVGMVFAVIIFYLPLFCSDSMHDGLLFSIHNAFRVFTAGNESDTVTMATFHVNDGFARVLCLYSAILYLLAPILSVGFALSFFRNVEAYVKYATHYKRDIVIVSSLTRESLALAQSVRRKSKKTMIIFAGISNRDDDEFAELLREAEMIKAVLFQKDILYFQLRFHKKDSLVRLFFLEKDEDTNLQLALQSMNVLRERKNTEIYIFATSYGSELLIDGIDREQYKLKRIRRINQRRALAYKQIYTNPIFEHAIKLEGDDRKRMNVMIVGMGQFGTELLKALTWSGQMSGYELVIHAFDRDEKIASRFARCCPELVEKSGCTVAGETSYEIHFHGGIDVDTREFDEEVLKLPDTTDVFICLGDDTRDIETAVRVRILMTRSHYQREKMMVNDFPAIHTVVYDSRKGEILADLKRFGKDEYCYNIDYIGTIQECYDIDVIEDEEMEQRALEQHLKWANNEEMRKEALSNYERFEYYRRSSLASALHSMLVDRFLEQDETAALLEHKRWNAYMRSEGYVYSGDDGKESRNDMALQHHNLIPFDGLDEATKQKDVNMLNGKE